jgi:hypothetical protein
MNPNAPSEEPSRDDARVVEDEKFVALKKFAKFQKTMIFELACGAVYQEKARSFPAIQRPLSNLLLRQAIIELVQAHKTWSLAGFCLTPRNERGSLGLWGRSRCWCPRRNWEAMLAHNILIIKLLYKN